MSLHALAFESVFLFAILPQMFAVMGHVRDNSGRPVSSIRVSLVDENYQPLRTVFSDSSGRFEFKGLRSGVYFVRVEPVGTPYEERSERLELLSMSQRRSAGEEPFSVEIILKNKHEEKTKPDRGVLFWQEVPDAARAEYERGADQLRKNKPDAGLAALKKSIEIFPDYHLALELLGTEYVKRGEFDAALPVLTHAVEVNQSAPKSLYALGVANLKLNKPAEAIQWLERAVLQDSKNPNVYMMLGLAYGNGHALDQSESSFKRAYDLGGELAADAHLYLAGIYNKQEKYSEAVKELDLYLKEAKDVKDPAQIRAMIEKLKAKQKAKN